MKTTIFSAQSKLVVASCTYKENNAAHKIFFKNPRKIHREILKTFNNQSEFKMNMFIIFIFSTIFNNKKKNSQNVSTKKDDLDSRLCAQIQ